MEPKVAVVILNWNGEKLLTEFLPSVVAHSQAPDVEIVVADNGSTDGSVNLLREQFPAVRILLLDENYGFARGYNEALKKVKASYVLLLNSDVEVVAGWLDPMVSLLDTNPEIAAVQPKILSYQQKDFFEYAGAAGGFLDRFGFPFCRGRILNVTEKDTGQYNQLSDIFWGSGAALLIRSEVFHRAGGFDPDFWAHMEEIDLCWRVHSMGFRVVYCPGSHVFHVGGGSLPYSHPKKLFLNFRNNLWLLYKNLPAEKLFTILFMRLIFDGMAALKLAAEGNIRGFFSVLRAHLLFYRSIPALNRKRNHNRRIGQLLIPKVMYSKSMIVNFYFRKKTRYSDLEN